jgi:hypothetical protein
MNTADFITVCLVFAVLPMVGGYLLGYRAGIKRGEAEGWLEHYDECVARDRARRRRNGQFKSAKGGAA